MIVSIIFAMNAARIIGNNGELPWRLKSDLKRFKELTTGHPVIMGRKTFRSIGKPLPNRQNIIITSNARSLRCDDTFRDCMFVSSLQDALDLIPDNQEVFIIGGAEIYEQALPIADRMYFTQVAGDFEGDVKFPLFNMNDWATAHDELVTTDEHPYAFSIMQRVARGKSLLASLHNDKELVNPTFARGRGGYDKTLAEIINSGVCPFCPDHFLWHPWPILHRVGSWFITRIGWSYKNAEHHFLIIGDRHIIDDTQMTIRDEICIRQLTKWAVQTFDLKGRGRISRSGDTNHTGATVQHLHFHLIQPKIGPDGKALTVWFPIG